MADRRVDVSAKPRRPTTMEYERRQARVRSANPKGHYPRAWRCFLCRPALLQPSAKPPCRAL
ncbi:hypothetical protein MGG_12323 [Pyricularia oryzae 70-15]|uniref:Uncharacterized protein n=1 Tax=Pyricularia oryzae (strain 70-15 / ATCC MYA-4617 / FGSC 8958) TaxID=242507 RepID=G4MZN2_PYRO7|nr:uncharacterized protein MGG_12323 [Pyricularia oryzae 70-15]EHA55396.1 hypothetical protein MGG_12323 [Pyricularia oryzae 70-15]